MRGKSELDVKIGDLIHQSPGVQLFQELVRFLKANLKIMKLAIPRTQMGPLVLIGIWALFWRVGSLQKFLVSWVPGENYEASNVNAKMCSCKYVTSVFWPMPPFNGHQNNTLRILDMLHPFPRESFAKEERSRLEPLKAFLGGVWGSFHTDPHKVIWKTID